MKKKGFTLIELLAVIVVLAILMLVAGSNVFGILDEAQKGSFRTEFLSLLQSAQNKANVDIMNQVITGKNKTKCYSMKDLEDYFINRNNYSGSVQVTYESGKLTVSGWMSSDRYIIENKGESIAADEVGANDSARDASSTCGA